MPTPNETKPRQFRLTDAEIAQMDRLMEHHALSSRAQAIRFALNIAVGQLPPKRKAKTKPDGTKP